MQIFIISSKSLTMLLVFVVFRGKNFMYEVVTETVDKFPKWLQVTIEYASSASFIALLFCILG